MPIMPILMWLIGPIGKYVTMFAVVVALTSGVYLKGRSDGVTGYKAKLEREIKRAIEKGDTAREEALRKFDANKEVEDDGFARKD
jgi:hypothetical protein